MPAYIMDGMSARKPYQHLLISSPHLADIRAQKQRRRDDLLAEMDDHNTAIIKIKTRLNTLVPISTLPSELLADIFQIVVQANRDALVSTSPPYAWVAVTHVCTHWRAVALGTPTLWSDIVLPCRPQCVREMLLRSQGVPLSVHHRAATTRRRQDDLHAQIGRAHV